MDPKVTLPEILFEAEIKDRQYRVVKLAEEFFILELCHKDSMKKDRWDPVWSGGPPIALTDPPVLGCSILFRLIELMKRSKQLEYLDKPGRPEEKVFCAYGSKDCPDCRERETPVKTTGG